MTLEDSIHSQRLRVVRDAAQTGNVSAAWRRHGLSRTLFYRRRLEQYGPDGVHPKRQAAGRGRPPAVPVQTERRVLALALAWPTCGPQWYSDQQAREGVAMAAVTIWRLLRRHQLTAFESHPLRQLPQLRFGRQRFGRAFPLRCLRLRLGIVNRTTQRIEKPPA